ncbi:MAG: beta-galactosidase [Candidatus Doudnabacteria bacterium]
MHKLKYWAKIFGFVLGAILIFLSAIAIVFYFYADKSAKPAWGVNFATGQSRFLGFEPPVLMNKIVDELNPKYIRLTSYWEEIEPTQGEFDFSSIDQLLNITDNSQSKVVLVVGHKQPRWPECHHPDWWRDLSPDQQTEALHNMIEKSVEHYKDHPSIWAWQLENEPFFDFGEECGVITRQEYKASAEIIRQIDSRPIIVTDSGEKSLWLTAAWAGADYFGATMYRQVYHGKKEKYITYPLPAISYTIKTGMIKLLSPTNYGLGMELQAEPWFNGDPYSTPIEEQKALMNPEIFAQNVAYAKASGFSQHYFWGAEWWFWLDARGDSSMLDAAKKVFAQ